MLEISNAALIGRFYTEQDSNLSMVLPYTGWKELVNVSKTSIQSIPASDVWTRGCSNTATTFSRSKGQSLKSETEANLTYFSFLNSHPALIVPKLRIATTACSI